MSTMTICAEFPLGTFLGHRDVGRRAPFPDTARLFSALVHAASKGMSAQVVAGDLTMTDASAASLNWLEHHPPTTLSFPEAVVVAARPAYAWRSEGVFEKRRTATQSRKVLKQQSAATAINGAYAWTWHDVPDHVYRTCDDLVRDVSCLGEADSPVRLTVKSTAVEPTHALDEARTGFPAPGGMPVRTPVPGRLSELNQDHDRARGSKPPTVAQDKYAVTQVPTGASSFTRRVLDLTYRPTRQSVGTPWTHAIIVPVKEANGATFGDPRSSVGWAVAMHRALAAGIGDEAPPLLTGAYPAGAERPSNRIAIHCLPAMSPVGFALESAAYAILVPERITVEEVAPLHRALSSLREIRTSARPRRRTESQEPVHLAKVEPFEVVSASGFWRPVSPERRRLWAPRVPIIPEVRPHRSRGWDLETVAKVSIGYVWRDLLPDASTRADLVTSIEARGVKIYDPHLVLDSHVSRYVHRAPANVVVQPYSCVVDLGDLTVSRAVAAVGQSRHLGGGLLFPVDVALLTQTKGEARS